MASVAREVTVAKGLRPDGEDSPGAGNAFQLVLSPVVKLKARTDGQVADGARNEDLAWPGESCDASANVDSKSTEIIATSFALTSVDSRSRLHPDVAQTVDDVPCGSYGSSGTIEGCEEPVARCVDLASAEAGERASYEIVVPI